MGKPYLRHSWGNKPEQKKREAEYNHEYYANNKDKWKKYNANSTDDSTLGQYVAQDLIDKSNDRRNKRFKEYQEISKTAESLKNNKNNGAAAYNEASRASNMAFKAYEHAMYDTLNSVVTGAAITTGEELIKSIFG